MNKILDYWNYIKLKEDEYISNHVYSSTMTEKEKQSFIRTIRSKCDKYEISPIMYLKILEYQNYSCAICGKPKENFSRNFSLDHNHDCINCEDEGTFREIRGFLCTSCNLLLGNAMDSNKLLRTAISYLQDSLLDKVYVKSIPHFFSSDYDELFLEQNGRCKMCQMEQSRLNKKLSVDHDHVTGKIRGLLCQRCNAVLGLCHDDIRILTKAIIYLKRNIWKEIDWEDFEGCNPFSDDYKKSYYKYLAENGYVEKRCDKCGKLFLGDKEDINILCQDCLKKEKILGKVPKIREYKGKETWDIRVLKKKKYK
jgi:hypothetical protein